MNVNDVCACKTHKPLKFYITFPYCNVESIIQEKYFFTSKGLF